MEDKVNYTVVGAFVLALGAALIAAVLWLSAGITGKKHYDTYQSIIRESVAGLSLDAPVKYLGVNVGKVSEIVIDPKDSSQVRLRFRIETGTPIKEDTEAVLKTQGLTGIAFVELTGGTAGAKALVAANGDDIPTITSKLSLSTRLENVLTTVLANVDRMSDSLNAVFDAGNRAALKQTLADTSTLMHELAAQKGNLSAGIEDAARIARNTAQASAKFGKAIDRITAAADRITVAADSVDKLGKTATTASESAARSVDAAANGIQKVAADSGPALTQLLEELNQLAASLQRLSEQTAQNPNSLLLGAPKIKPGPGEKVTP
ncbi:MAG: MlaD family protein [Casimicrobium sp.]